MVKKILFVFLIFFVSCSDNWYQRKRVDNPIIQKFTLCYPVENIDYNFFSKGNIFISKEKINLSANSTETILTQECLVFKKDGFYSSYTIQQKSNEKSIDVYCNYDGLFEIFDDTIKVQRLGGVPSLMNGWVANEVKYLIGDSNTLSIADYIPLDIKSTSDFITFNKYYKQKYLSQKFIRFAFPDSLFAKFDNPWLKNQKWFWCDEQEWKAYRDSIK